MTALERVAADAEARREALDTTRSIILQAPAGSGKTTILTQRFLALLTTVERPESVLAMTFTRKAAAEMQARILAALEDVHSPAPPKDDVQALTRELARAATAHGVALGWHLAENPSRLRILTIDGLNRQLAAAVPITANGVGDYEVAQHPERMLRDVARRSLIEAERDAELRVHSERILQHLGNAWSRAEELIAAMLNTRARWLRPLYRVGRGDLRAYVERNLRDVCLAERRAIFAALGGERIARGVSLAEHVLGERVPGDLTIDTPAVLRALANLVLTKNGTVRVKANASIGFPAGGPNKAAMQAWLDEVRGDARYVEALLAMRDLPDVAFDDDAAATIDSLLVMLEYASAQLVRHFSQTGRADYTAIAAAARELVCADSPPSELALHQGETLRHLLIDEFQDTSVDQYELLQGLTRDWVPGDGRSLFVVGDPMQSIYQFREAEVGLFLDVRERGLGAIKLKSLTLTRNFRSQSAIVDFVNTTFASVFPREDAPVEGAVRYLPCIAAAKPTEYDAGVYWHVFEQDEAYARREAEEVLSIVRRTRAQDPRASIAVLVGAREHGREIVLSLRRAGFAVRGVDLLPLAETAVVQELIALARAMHSPLDRVAWLALLRGPCCGLSLQDLTRLTHDGQNIPIPLLCADAARLAGLSDEGHTAIVRLLGRLEPWRTEGGRDPLAQTSLAARVEAAWLRLDGAACHDSESVLLDARRFLDTFAAEIEAGDWQGPEDFAAMLDGLYAASEAGESAVQVMTVHRSKGLEFDCVVLPGLGRTTRADTESMLDFLECVVPDAQGDEVRRLIMAPVTAADAEKSSVSKWLQTLRRRRTEREYLRVLYVATTRARRVLHCCGAIKETDVSGLAPAKTSPLGRLWPAVSVAALRDYAERNATLAMVDASVTSVNATSALHRLRVARAVTPWPQDVMIERLPLSSGELEAGSALEFAVASELARTVGIVVHRELERLAGAKSLPSATEIARSADRFAIALQAEGLERDELEAGVARVVEALQRTLADDRGRWILAPHEDDRVEWALTGVHEGVIASIVIDRCFVERGVRWIVDYKTSTHEGTQLEEFIDVQTQRYTPQLRRYAALARRLGSEPVRGALYFPLLGKFVEIELPDHQVAASE